MKKIIAFFIIAVFSSCSVSYKFNGASIDYSKTKTINISDFANLAPLVNPVFAPQFNDALKDIYTKQTRLRPVNGNADLKIEGEITGYDLTPMSIGSDAVAAETRLTVTIKVRFTNKTNPQKDFEKTMSAYQNFPSTKMLTDVQDDICKAIIDELTESIYNQTVADW